MRLLKCIDNINNIKSTKGEHLKHGEVEKKGKIADNLNNTGGRRRVHQITTALVVV